jgi:single-strand DNA-binding protein
MENYVQLIGNLGMDPETKQINDTVKATFTLATNTVYKDSDGNKKSMTDWHNIVAWGGLAQTLEQYVKKGDKIGVSGRLVTRSYENEEGVKKYFTEVIAKDLLMLGGRKAES